jgi:hypothetical protein
LAPTEEQRISGFINRHGGANIEEAGALRGEYEALLENGGRKAGVVKRATGKSPDELAQLAHEAGFIDEPDPQLLKEALERDLGGEHVYSAQSHNFDHNLNKQLAKEADDYFDMEAEQAVGELEERVRKALEENPEVLATLKKMEMGEPVTMQGKARDILDQVEKDIGEIDAIKTCLSGPAEKTKVKLGSKVK